MTPLPPAPDIEASEEIFALIESLQASDRRLEQLTGGEVDTVVDRHGNAFLLQHAQVQARDSEAIKQAAILYALPARIVLLDAQGTIISVNEAWRKFGRINGLRAAQDALEMNYLEVCQRATGSSMADAQNAAQGIAAVLQGRAEGFSFEYASHAASEPRWFLMSCSPLLGDHAHGAVVMHLDITRRKVVEEEHQRFRTAMDAIADGVMLVDRASMRYVHANMAACTFLACSREELLARDPWVVVGSSRADLERTFDGLIANTGGQDTQELALHRPDGSLAWLEVRRHAQNSAGRWTIVTLVRDVTGRRRAEAKIVQLNRVYAVLSGINTLIVRVKDRDELFNEACRVAVEAGGFRMSWICLVDEASASLNTVAFAGGTPALLAAISARNGLGKGARLASQLAALAVRESRIVVSNDLRNDPDAFFGPLHEEHGIRSGVMLPLLVADKVVGVLGLYAGEVGFFRTEEVKLLAELAGDIAFAMDHLETGQRLQYLAYYDGLTGLANRSLFLERVAQYARSAAGAGHKLALFLVDIERFRSINESLGRPAGDALLVQAAHWLTHYAADVNLLAHVGADQFAIVLPQVRPDGDVAHLIEKTVQAFLQHPFRLKEGVFRIAVKVGAALFPDDGNDADTLFRNAEAALKRAKAGGERYRLYEQAMNASVAGKLTLENQLRQALEQSEFVLHYQPKISLKTGRVTGAEALLRWNDPRTGMVPPGRFIPILEETGLIHDVGRWALRQAISDYQRWRAAGLPVVRIAVNVSPLQLRDRGFANEIRQVIGTDGHAAAGLELEITESLIMDDVDYNITTLRAIRDMGVRVAIDDFGTGFSSLSYLARLPLDTLKIDQSFVTEMTASPQGLALVSTIVSMAHALNLNVVAEGVETEEQRRLLRLLYCDEMQGFQYSGPVAGEAFEADFLALATRMDAPPA